MPLNNTQVVLILWLLVYVDWQLIIWNVKGWIKVFISMNGIKFGDKYLDWLKVFCIKCVVQRCGCLTHQHITTMEHPQSNSILSSVAWIRDNDRKLRKYFFKFLCWHWSFYTVIATVIFCWIAGMNSLKNIILTPLVRPGHEQGNREGHRVHIQTSNEWTLKITW